MASRCLVLSVVLGVVGCSLWAANPLYCDESTPCADPALPRCDLVRHECLPGDDGGFVRHDAAPDDAPEGGDGAACPVCDGATPACADGRCVCTATSCPAATPICDAAGTCRGCTSHTECSARDPERPVCAGPTCEPNVCGDRYVDATKGERCDDGNHDNGDGCDPTCRYTGTMTTIAGRPGGAGHCNDTGTKARFFGPQYLTHSGSTAFFSQVIGGENVKRLAFPSLSVTSVTGLANVSGVATDGTYLYAATNRTIQRVPIAGGSPITMAGAPGQLGSNDAAVGTDARFSNLKGLTIVQGTLYAVDGCAIRGISRDATYAVSTVAGVASACGTATDGAGAAARFVGPGHIGGRSDLYVTDGHAVRRVTLAGVVSTLWGQPTTSGYLDAAGTAARFNGPRGVVNGVFGKLQVVDGVNSVIREIDQSSGAVTTVVGVVGVTGGADGVGSAVSFLAPYGLAEGGSLLGNDLLIADGATIRRITPATWVTQTVAGQSPSPGAVDGANDVARLATPMGGAVVDNVVLFTDTVSCTLRQVVPETAQVTTLAGTAGHCAVLDGVGSLAGFVAPGRLVAVAAGVEVVDQDFLREFHPGTREVVTRVTGLSSPLAVATDGAYMYVSEPYVIRRITLGTPWDVTPMIEDSAGLGEETFLQVVGSTLFVGDPTHAVLRAVDISNPAGPYSLTTLAGAVDEYGTADGVAAAARFMSPGAMAFDGTSLFLADGSVIRQVDLATMRVTTLTGRSDCRSTIDGDHSMAAFSSGSLTYVPSRGSLVLFDMNENVVREIR